MVVGVGHSSLKVLYYISGAKFFRYRFLAEFSCSYHFFLV